MSSNFYRTYHFNTHNILTDISLLKPTTASMHRWSKFWVILLWPITLIKSKNHLTVLNENAPNECDSLLNGFGCRPLTGEQYRLHGCVVNIKISDEEWQENVNRKNTVCFFCLSKIVVVRNWCTPLGMSKCYSRWINWCDSMLPNLLHQSLWYIFAKILLSAYLNGMNSDVAALFIMRRTNVCLLVTAPPNSAYILMDCFTMQAPFFWWTFWERRQPVLKSE